MSICVRIFSGNHTFEILYFYFGCDGGSRSSPLRCGQQKLKSGPRFTKGQVVKSNKCLSKLLGLSKSWFFQKPRRTLTVSTVAPLVTPPNVLHRFNAVGRTRTQIQEAECRRDVKVCRSKLEAGGETPQCLTSWPLAFQNDTLEEERARFLQISSCTGTKSVHFKK